MYFVDLQQAETLRLLRFTARGTLLAEHFAREKLNQN